MDRQKDKSEQIEQRKNENPPGQNAGEADRGADSEKAHMGQSFVTWANAGVLGFHMISGPLLGIFLGYYLDKWLNSSPVCVGIGLALGLVAGALNMYRDMRRILREQAAEDAREKLRRMGLGKDETPRRQDGDGRAAEPSENHVFREGDPRVSARTADREVSDKDAREKLRRMGLGKDETPRRQDGDATDNSEAGDNDDDYSDPSSGYGRGGGERK